MNAFSTVCQTSAAPVGAGDLLRAACPGLSRKTARQLLRHGPYSLGLGYEAGRWDTPHLDEYLTRLFRGQDGRACGAYRLPLLTRWACERLFNPQLGPGAFRVGKAHYSLGNDLFAVMLDPTMSYTCAYWHGAADLAQAQLAKLDLVCRKLELRPGLRLLDIGCGWGNLAHHAAAHYGVRVVGLTVSEAQAEYARQYCAGLPVEIRFGDYRHLQERFDRVASIEMIEAVGRKNLRGFFATVDRVLEPGGLFLLQAITAETFSPRSRPDLDLFVLWLERHIFPNGYLPKVTELTDPCRDRFKLLDWHDFGDCYDRTLMAWAARFDGGFATLAGRYGEAFRRRWDYYLHGCAAAFRAGLGQVCQVLYAKPGARRPSHPVR